MSEQPESYPGKEPSIDFTIGGEAHTGTPDNCSAYLHYGEGQAKYDHIFLAIGRTAMSEEIDYDDSPDDEVVEIDEEEGDETRSTGFYMFRHKVLDFDRVVEYMREAGYDTWEVEKVSDTDKAVFDNFYPELNEPELDDTQEIPVVVEEIEPPTPLEPLEPRLEARPLFLRWLLDHDRLDFGQEGNLFL